MFGFLRARRRRRLAAQPFPPEWEQIVAARLTFLQQLAPDEIETVRSILKVFAWEKRWFGAHGLEVTDEMKVVISGAAAELARGIGIEAYDRLVEIVIYPSHYRHPDQPDAVIFGEANRFGVVVLSWDAVKHGIANANDGHHVAIHELAHVLDAKDGAFDGTPELQRSDDYRAWAKVCTEHFLRLRQRPHKSVVRRYGATNEAEFFACATEAFFEKPQQLATRAPDLYALLARYYRIDPAAVRRRRVQIVKGDGARADRPARAAARRAPDPRRSPR